MKTFLLILLIGLPSMVCSQFNRSIDLQMGIDQSYRFLQTDSSDPTVQFILTNRQRESSKVAFRLGINFNQRLVRRLHLKTGLRFAALGYKGEIMDSLIFPSTIDSVGNIVPGTTEVTLVQMSRDYLFIELPFILRYEFGNSAIGPFIEAGMSPHVYLTTRVNQEGLNNTTTTYSDQSAIGFHRFHLVGSLSAGLRYSPDWKWSYFVQPLFRYHLTRLLEAPIQENLYTLGIEFGVRRSIH